LIFADLYCEGELVWNNIDPGEIIEGSFNVENIGDPESELDWEIDSFPEWGAWSFNPSQGEDLTPEDGPITINVEVTAPSKGDIEYVGEVKVVNKNDPDDYYIIPVSLNIKGPDLDCAGNLIWNDVKPGENIEGSFIVKNKGPDGSLLDWRINSSPEWGIWTFTPESGNDLRPEDGSITINVEVVAPDENNKKFTGEVIVINTENPNDFCEINVILNTPKHRVLKINLLIPQLLRNFPELLIIFNRFIQSFRIKF
jgi:hypothetical protein